MAALLVAAAGQGGTKDGKAHKLYDPHGSDHRLRAKRPEKFELDAPKATPSLPRHEKHWHKPLELKQGGVRPHAKHGPTAPEPLRRRALLEQAFGRGAVQEYLSHRDNVGLLDLGRERLRKAVVIAEGFAPLRVIAEESQLLHVLAEAVYALDTRHMKVGRERVYHAYDLLDALSPEDPKAVRLNDEWTDLGGVCAHSPDCSEFSYCEKGRCQPPKFPRPTRLFVTQMLEQLKQRVLEHIWDFGKDDIDSSARMWGGNGTNATEAAVSAAKVRLQLHAGRADPLLDQDAAVIRNLLATAVGAGVNADSILQLQILQDVVEFEVHGTPAVDAANVSARAGGLAGLGRAALERFDPHDVTYTRPNAGVCSSMDVHTECCSGRDNRQGRLNGLQVLDSPCQIVMRNHGQWECQPEAWVYAHLHKTLEEDVVVVGCNATEDVQHITKHIGHKRRLQHQEDHHEDHHAVRYRVAHNWAIEDDRIPDGHTGKTHPELVPHWHRFDSRHKAAEACDEDTECVGYTCNTMSFKTHKEDDDHVKWCELRLSDTSTQHEGHARGIHAPGHISFFKRYDTVGAFAAEHSALPIPDPIPKPLHSALAAAQNRSAGAHRPCQPLAGLLWLSLSPFAWPGLGNGTDLADNETSLGMGAAAEYGLSGSVETEEAAAANEALQQMLDRTRQLPGQQEVGRR